MQTDMKSLLVNAFSRIPNYVFIKDATLVYRTCNQNFAEFSGFNTCDAVEGKSDYDMPWSRTHAALYREEDLAIIKTGKSFELKEVAMNIGKKKKVLLISKAPLLNDAQEVEGILGIYIDISEQKNLERELLIAKDKAEAASRSKSEFIANMSHDIRTPITGVLAMAQQLLSSVDKSKSALTQSNQLNILDNLMQTVTNNSQLLMNATNELLTLCNDILGVVQLESGKTRQAKETFHIPTLVQHTTNLLTPVAKDKSLKLTSTIDPAVPDYLTGERLYLNRILLNITSNALKFTNNGFVRINMALADTTTSPKPYKPGDIIKIKLTIEDSGMGIPKDKQEVIFEHFSRLTESYSGVYKGAGLGLYTVKNYVKSMKGTITVESEINQGSKFTVILPFKIADHTTIQALKSAEKIDMHDESQDFINTIMHTKTPKNINPLQIDKPLSIQEGAAKILIVEDSQLAAIGLKTQLKTHLCQVDIAENGQQAILMAKQKTYDLIFMDMGLPDIGGIEVTKKIRSFQNEKKSQVPIVAITGHGDNPDRKQACLEAGIQNVLCKPAQPKALASILNNFVFRKTD